MTIGNLIKRAREAKGLTLQALADKMGKSKQLVWQWENGDSDPRKHVKALSLYLDQPIEYFYATKHAPALVEAKYKLLTPEQQAAVDTLMDTFLSAAEAKGDKRA